MAALAADPCRVSAESCVYHKVKPKSDTLPWLNQARPLLGVHVSFLISPDLDQIAGHSEGPQRLMWQPISTAPFDRDLELSVIDKGALQALVFACRRLPSGWIDAELKKWIDVHPTHWREWVEKL